MQRKNPNRAPDFPALLALQYLKELGDTVQDDGVQASIRLAHEDALVSGLEV